MKTDFSGPVMEGRVETLADCVKHFARNTGFAMHFGFDDPAVPFPRQISPSASLSAECLATKSKLAFFENLRGDTLEYKFALAKAEFDLAEIERRRNETVQQTRLTAMIAMITSWVAPKSCFGLKEFILRELKAAVVPLSPLKAFGPRSLNLESRPYQSAVEWRDNMIRCLGEELAFCNEMLERESEEIAKANAWLRNIFEAIGDPLE